MKSEHEQKGLVKYCNLARPTPVFFRIVSEFAFGRQQGCYSRHGNLCKATKEDSICILFKQLVDISKFVTEPQPNLHILVANDSNFANAILHTFVRETLNAPLR